jgi:hypothetical protein
MATEKCLYDRWMDGEERNLNKFTLSLLMAFQYADGVNRRKIMDNWPDYFRGSVNI